MGQRTDRQFADSRHVALRCQCAGDCRKFERHGTTVSYLSETGASLSDPQFLGRNTATRGNPCATRRRPTPRVGGREKPMYLIRRGNERRVHSRASQLRRPS
jgi:hypothetical protein